MTDILETEVKFAIRDLAAVKQTLKAANAKLVQPRTRELNLRFDTAGNTLQAAGKVLRLRRDRQVHLTLKLPAGPWGERAKTLREIEVVVSDFDAARHLLEGLGYRIWLTYEKFREVQVLDGVQVCLDELPFGSFVELEGDLVGIDAAATRLNLPEDRRVTAGYVDLFFQARDRMGIPLQNCTFAEWSRWQNLA